MKLKNQIALALLVMAAGCATHKDRIVFSDDAAVRAAVASAVAPSTQKKLTAADALKIEQMVLGYLLERHFWDLGDYSAVFLSTDDTQVAAMIKQYPDHVPPIKTSAHVSARLHRTPMDKDTNKPAMVLSAEVNEPNADDSVDALGRWYAGDAVKGFRAFNFKKVDGEWQIAAVK